MGLVQAQQAENNKDFKLEKDGVTILWDEQIQQMIQLYGKLVIDYFKGFMGGRVYVGLEGVSSC